MMNRSSVSRWNLWTMTFQLAVAALLFAATGPTAKADTKRLEDLRVLYVGSERADDFVGFLSDHVSKAVAISREDFRAEDARDFDVVLLDWPQSEEARAERAEGKSPLGSRDEWHRPTVLLGSAGLNLACVWQLRGGSGCTCLDPVAYDLKEHPIFDAPFRINRDTTIEIETPEAFVDDLDETKIKVIAIVDERDRKWRSGWCTYSTAFDEYPDVEFFCGGVNEKTPTAAAIWRQGNLLHFGFQQSPREMNSVGDQLLLNSIAYISNFSQDHPIAITPSVFVGPRARPRSTVASWLKNPDRKSWVEGIVTEELWQMIESQGDAESMANWAEEHTAFLTTDPKSKITIDEDLLSIKMGFDDPTFIEFAINELESGDEASVARAKRLLGRYVPDGPNEGSAAKWRDWHAENKPYLFATDFGHYRWYIDPLAKHRGIPTTELRGIDRMDVR